MGKDIVALVSAVKKTIEFEKELCVRFQEKERPVITDDDDDDEGITVALSAY